jgi:hypothetical protein
VFRFRRFRVFVFALVALLVVMNNICSAADSAFREVFRDGVYGGLAGAVAGAVLTALTRKPSDHTDRIAYGAGVGVVAGTIFGLLKIRSSGSLLEVEKGRVLVGGPIVVPEIREGGAKGKDVVVKADIVSGKF